MKRDALPLLEKLVWNSEMPPAGEMGPQVQNKQAKHLKVNNLYVQTVSVKIPDKLFRVNEKMMQKHDVKRRCRSMMWCPHD